MRARIRLNDRAASFLLGEQIAQLVEKKVDKELTGAPVSRALLSSFHFESAVLLFILLANGATSILIIRLIS